MKKQLKRLLLVLLAVTTGYTAAASVLTRGLGVYRMNTALGRVLAVSRPYTGLAALLLWAAALVWLARWLRGRRTAGGQEQAQAEQPEQPAKPRRAGGKKIAPKGGTMPMPQAEADNTPIAPRGGTMPMPQAEADNAPIAPRGATMPMPQGRCCPRCGHAVRAGAKFCGKCGTRLEAEQ